MMMNRDDVKEKVNRFLIEELEIEEYKLSEDASLKEQVGIDSLDYVDIIAFVGKTFGLKIDKEELKDVSTLGQFYDYIKNRLCNV